jgi:acetyltransferase-like isoleucine patch superfamily enzyme
MSGQDSLKQYMGGASLGMAGQYFATRAASLLRYVVEQGMQALFGWIPGPLGTLLRALAYRPLMARRSRFPFTEHRVELFHMNRIRTDAGVYVDSDTRLHASRAEIILGPGTRVMRGSYLCTYVSNARAGEGIQTGSCCWIGVGAVLSAGQGGIVLGDNVLIGPQATLVCGNHDFSRTDVATLEQAYTGRPIRVGANVWIGAQAVILGGVTIGDRAVVAAGAVVTADVEPGVVVGGVPARKIKSIPQEP